ncbi:MAG: tyrosine-protein phosphatase [Candidatus Xenobia bacterium]
MLRLLGTRNTRQLGGLPIAGGRVRRDCLWRSDALNHLEEADVATLQRLGIRTVIHFRTAHEIQKHSAATVTSRVLRSFRTWVREHLPSS